MSLTMMATCWNQRSLLRRVDRCRPPGRRRCQVFGQLELLLAQPEPDDPQSHAEDTGELFPVAAGHLGIGFHREGKHPGVELERTIHVRDREAHHRHSCGRGKPDGRPIKAPGTGRGAT